MPKWLWFDEGNRTLKGIPSTTDEGESEILIVGLRARQGNSLRSICGLLTVKIVVWILKYFPLFSLSTLTSPVIDKKLSTCQFNEPIVLASLVLAGNFYEMAGKEKMNVLDRLLQSYHISMYDVFILSTSDDSLMDLLATSNVLASGPGANRNASGYSSTITWHVKCGVIQLDDPLFQAMEKLSQQVTFINNASYSPIGWHVVTGFQERHIRRRRNVEAGTTTPAYRTIPISKATIITTRIRVTRTTYVSATKSLTWTRPLPTFSSPHTENTTSLLYSPSSTVTSESKNTTSLSLYHNVSSTSLLMSLSTFILMPASPQTSMSKDEISKYKSVGRSLSVVTTPIAITSLSHLFSSIRPSRISQSKSVNLTLSVAKSPVTMSLSSNLSSSNHASETSFLPSVSHTTPRHTSEISHYGSVSPTVTKNMSSESPVSSSKRTPENSKHNSVSPTLLTTPITIPSLSYLFSLIQPSGISQYKSVSHTPSVANSPVTTLLTSNLSSSTQRVSSTISGKTSEILQNESVISSIVSRNMSSTFLVSLSRRVSDNTKYKSVSHTLTGLSSSLLTLLSAEASVISKYTTNPPTSSMRVSSLPLISRQTSNNVSSISPAMSTRSRNKSAVFQITSSIERKIASQTLSDIRITSTAIQNKISTTVTSATSSAAQTVQSLHMSPASTLLRSESISRSSFSTTEQQLTYSEIVNIWNTTATLMTVNQPNKSSSHVPSSYSNIGVILSSTSVFTSSVLPISTSQIISNTKAAKSNQTSYTKSVLFITATPSARATDESYKIDASYTTLISNRSTVLYNSRSTSLFPPCTDGCSVATLNENFTPGEFVSRSKRVLTSFHITGTLPLNPSPSVSSQTGAVVDTKPIVNTEIFRSKSLIPSDFLTSKIIKTSPINRTIYSSLDVTSTKTEIVSLNNETSSLSWSGGSIHSKSPSFTGLYIIKHNHVFLDQTKFLMKIMFIIVT